MPIELLLAAGSAVENVAAHDLSVLNPASPQAESIKLLFYIVTAVSLLILAVVWGVLFYSLAKFRRQRTTGSTNEKEPPQVYGSMPIEIAWTVAPGLIVFLLVLVIVRTELDVRRPASKQPEQSEIINVTVIGHQWWWEYVIHEGEAPTEASAIDAIPAGRNSGVVTANELHLPASTSDVQRPIYLTLLSADVCHSFWVPRLGGKTDLIPGRKNWMWFRTAEPGHYVGQCAEYCGTQHANMLLHVFIESPEEYAAWLENEKKPAIEDPAFIEGRRAFFAESCVNCHTIRGTTAAGKFGPDLTHLASRKTFAGGMIPLTHDNLWKWIKDPKSIKPGCLMPPFGLSDKQISQITDYLMSLK